MILTKFSPDKSWLFLTCPKEVIHTRDYPAAWLPDFFLPPSQQLKSQRQAYPPEIGILGQDQAG